MSKHKFKEKQRYRDTLAFVLLGVGIAGGLYGIFDSLLAATPTFTHAAFFGVVTLLLSGAWWWLQRLQLKVSVNEKRIKFRMSPIDHKSHRIPWEEVESCQVYKTPQAAKWHGGNLPFGGESWYSLTGRNGLALATKDGHRYFIGCRDVDRLADEIEEISPRT